MDCVDLVIVGAGPSGLSCAIEAQKRGLSHLVIDKGCITDSIRRFPVSMRFFSSPKMLELHGLPFATNDQHPLRSEVLEYYRKVCEYFKIELLLHNEVTALEGRDSDFVVRTHTQKDIRARKVVIATGYFDQPNKLAVPGEELSHVHHYYSEAHYYSQTKVLVVGGGNSAVETALELYRHGAEVTIVHRGNAFRQTVKYWILPDIHNRIKAGEIKACMQSAVSEIQHGRVHIKNLNTDETEQVLSDFVIVQIGYRPETKLLEQIGVEVDPESLVPQHDPQSFETNVSGVYLAGSISCGCETGNIFIENGRLHAKHIVDNILKS